MRHGMVNRKLGRTSGHRLMMFRNQLASLIQSERIITTLPKAKELRPQIERLITLGKNDSVHARRNAARVIDNEDLVTKLFDTLGPRFSDRSGGYTRIIKLGPRRGDAAEMAILEFVGYELPKEEKAAPAAAKGGKKAEAPAETETPGETEEAPAAEEKPKKPAKKAAEAKPKAKPEPKAKPKAEPKAKATKKAESPKKKSSSGGAAKKKGGK